jgi:hypothetical protein
MTETAKLLGMSSSELTRQLQSGKPLDSVASSKGVSQSAVVKSVESDLKTNAPAGAPSLSGSQLTQLATSIASGAPPGAVGGPRGVGGPQAVGSTGGPGASQTGSAGGTKTLEEQLLAALEEAEESSESGSSNTTSSYDGSGTSTGPSGSTGGNAVSLYA